MFIPNAAEPFGTPVPEGPTEVVRLVVEEAADVEVSPTVETMSVRVTVAERVVIVWGGRVDGRTVLVGLFWSVPAIPNRGLVLFMSPSTATEEPKV